MMNCINDVCIMHIACILHMLHVAGLLCQAGSCEVGGGAASLASLAGSVPGVPGEDYPVLAAPPLTAFSCADKVAGGYYADTEARCQGEDEQWRLWSLVLYGVHSLEFSQYSGRDLIGLR